MKNHLVIGLGGTGGRVIRSLRKRVFQEHRSNDIPDIGLEYLYVDSSGELMDPGDRTWKILGTPVQLPPGNQLRISGANLREIVSDPRSYPGIRPWLGSRDLWQKVPADVITSGAGGQRRRLGRFLFAMKAQEFRAKIESLVLVTGKRTQTTGTAFHVVAGLAGGTGGGALIDVIAQIGAFSTNSQDSLVVYAVLPDRVPDRGWDAGNYHANGYAALIELNGLMIRRYQPWDVLRGLGRLEVTDLLNGAYIITNENENGLAVNVENELPAVVADFLYEIISESTDAKPPTQTLENFSGGPECVPGTEEAMRARKFSSFGIKRIAVPEEEITEYLTLSFARQAILQLYYNNWDDRFGFLEEALPRNYASLVSEKDTETRWLLTDEHLTLQLPILPEDVEAAKAKKWQPSIDSEWISIAAWIQPDYADLGRDRRLNDLHLRFEEIFNRGYRGRGAADFYKIAGAGKQKMARHIVRGIERELFEKWQEGTYSASEIGELLAALRIALEDRKKATESSRASLSEEIEAYNNELVSIRDEWGSLSFIMFPLKSKGLFEQYANACRELFRLMTEALALEFALGLIPQVLDALAGLRDSVNQVTARFEAGLDDFKKKIDARVDEKGAMNYRDAIVKYYDPKIVKKVMDNLITNYDEQRQVTDVVRKALIDDKRLGGELTFERFRERVAAVDLLDLLERTCEAQARMVHDKLVRSERERILGVQLMTRLRDEFGGSNEKLGEFARNVILPAKTFVRFDQTEERRDPASVGAPVVGGGAQRAIVVKRPAPEDLKEFVGRLDRALTQTDLAVRPPEENHGRPHELSVLSFVGNFPLRYLEILRLLRDKYRALVDGDGGPLAKLELHTEDEAFFLPDLYPETGAPKDGLAYLLLAEQLGVIREDEDPDTGKPLIVARVGKGAHQETLQFGETLDKVIDDLDHANFLKIKTEVDGCLAADYVHKNNKRALQTKLEARLEKSKAALKGGDLHPEFKKYREATIKAETILGVE